MLLVITVEGWHHNGVIIAVSTVDHQALLAHWDHSFFILYCISVMAAGRPMFNKIIILCILGKSCFFLRGCRGPSGSCTNDFPWQFHGDSAHSKVWEEWGQRYSCMGGGSLLQPLLQPLGKEDFYPHICAHLTDAECLGWALVWGFGLSRKHPQWSFLPH